MSAPVRVVAQARGLLGHEGVSAPQSFVDVIIQAAEIIGKEKQKKPLSRPAGKREYLLRQSSRPAGGYRRPVSRRASTSEEPVRETSWPSLSASSTEAGKESSALVSVSSPALPVGSGAAVTRLRPARLDS